MIEPMYRQHAATVKALAYRMTGSNADAEEITQETFARALSSPPRSGLTRNWLLAVAANLSRDRLRRRKRAAYAGPWLPAAIEAGTTPEAVDPEQRYGMIESASFAFLLALEPLTSKQRAVLLLRDVFELSVEETAEALAMKPGAVRVLHLRARRATERYDETRAIPSPERAAAVRVALERLGAAVAGGDRLQIESVLAEQASLYADGAGRFGALREVLTGASALAKFFAFGQQRFSAFRRSSAIWPDVNGAPALVIDNDPPEGSNVAPRAVLTCDVDSAGRITRLYVIAAPEKLSALPASPATAVVPMPELARPATTQPLS
ncbi:MAG: sigma-70 family RNA polymerase sigma factor [Myxococcaceae bacterium]